MQLKENTNSGKYCSERAESSRYVFNGDSTAFMHQKIVRSGIWYYDESAPIPVHIVEHDYDPTYEFFKAEAEDGCNWPSGVAKTPQLNAEGKVYRLLFGSVTSEHPWPVDQVSYMTAEEAASAIVERFGSRCNWE